MLGLICANLYIFYPSFTVSLWDSSVKYFDLIFNPRHAQELLTSAAPSDITEEEEESNDGITVIVLDPGHGGRDPGAVSTDETLRESEINLSIARKLKERLDNYEGIEVYLTHQTEDESTDPPELAQRVDFAGDVGADMLISIHNNANYSDYSGCEVYVSGRLDTQCAQDAQELAALILDNLGQLGMRRRGIFFRLSQAGWQDDGTPNDYYGIIRMGQELGIPTLLVENAFLNETDAPFISDDAALSSLADAHASAIAEYLGLEEQTLSPVLSEYTDGDVNADGSVTIDDRLIAQKAVMCEHDAPVLEQFSRADINSSGLIDAFDLYAVKELSAGRMLPSYSDSGTRTQCILSADTAAYAQGDTVTVWVQIGSYEDILAAAGTVDYNTQLFDFTGIETECDGLVLAEDSNFGLVRYCYLAPDDTDGNLSFALQFKMVGTPDGDALSFNLNCYSSIHSLDGAIYSTQPNCVQTTMSVSE